MKFLRIILVLLCSVLVSAEKVADLPELAKPASIAIDSSRLYICDNDTIHMYGLNPFDYKGKFGRFGEGPGEFNSRPHLTVYDDLLFINTMGKIMTFSKTGEFQEQTIIPFVYFYIYYPMLLAGSNYVGLPLKNIEGTATFIHSVNIYDSKLTLIKEIYQGPPPQLLPPPRPGTKVVKVDFEVIPECLETAVQGDRIYIADSRKGFFVSVFNENGEHLFDVEREFTPAKVSEEFKDEFWQETRSSENWEQLKQRFNYRIRDEYPAFFSMKIQGQKMYFSTYAQKDGLYEMIVLDLNGETLKQAFCFPLEPEVKLLGGIVPFSNEFAVHNDMLYYLVLNEGTMLFELHSRKISN
ncbi:MAG: hypothetical protein JRF40_01170 [Deltaproteobacteria bacterium]|nr:hypothetical protein [Deltaproteobacteria bacterium]